MTERMLKRKITTLLLMVVIVIICIILSNIKESNDESIINKQDNKYTGENLDISMVTIGELIVNDEGYNYLGKVRLDELYNAVNKISEITGYEYTLYNLEQNIEYNNSTNKYNAANVKKSYSIYSEDKESCINITAQSNGEYSKYASDIIINIIEKDWDTTNKELEAILYEIGLNDSLREYLVKSGYTREVALSYSSGETIYINIHKNETDKCETFISIMHKTTDLKKLDSIILPYGIEDVKEIASGANVIYSDIALNDMKINGNTLGTALANELNSELNKNMTVSMTASSFSGIKDSEGSVINEDFSFMTTLGDADGSERITISSIYNSSKSANAFEISSDDTTYSDEDVEIINNKLIKFLDYINNDNNVKSVDEIEKLDLYVQSSKIFKDNANRNIEITYGYMDKAYAINSVVVREINQTRSKSIKTYY